MTAVVVVYLSKGEGHGHPDDDLSAGEKETRGEFSFDGTSSCFGLKPTRGNGVGDSYTALLTSHSVVSDV